MLNPRLDALNDYPFDRLRALLDAHEPGGAPVSLALGEPQFAPPALLAETIAAHAGEWGRYPPVGGTEEFRAAAAGWLERRFDLAAGVVDRSRGVLPLSGTREGLFLLADVALPERKAGARPVVLMPNPFYQCYFGAAVMGGAEPVFVDAPRERNFLPDFAGLDRDLWARTALVYFCNPSNPQGAIADKEYLRELLALCRRHGAVLAVDECYAEIYDETPPPGALEVADGDFTNLLVFHSLSKRSSAAGLRAGFVAGDPELLSRFLRLRSYAAAGMPLPVQATAVALLGDEAHVEANRARYRRNFDIAEARFGNRPGYRRPAGGFFLWLETGDGEDAALRLWREAGIRALPGAYLARTTAAGTNPGAGFLRLALVHEPAELEPVLERAAAIV
jgi:aspartate/methionine/tyrosine aminotransferase